MTDPLSISLRPPVHYDRKADALQSVIPRINEQRGQFRNVTEASLEAEIQASQATGNDNVADDHDLDNGLDDSEGKDADADADAQDRRDEIMAARGEIMRQIGTKPVHHLSQAYMEAYYALDFVSLLLSKETPRQAEISMSELLRKRVPLGSLGADRVQTRAQPEADIADGELISRGWKLQGLNSAADSLLRSTSRLEKEIELETRYWEQVLTVGAKGWSLCRLPREKHTLGVRFGFAEATAPEFRDRGLAALRRSPSGSITLDQGLLDGRPRAIRVRIISSDGHSSAATPSAIAAGDSSVVALTPLDATNPESLILQARNTLYEEELFHELTREARLLANLGVRPIDGGALAITLPSSGATQGEPSQTTTITIGLVALEPTAQPATSAPAEALALALRILLSHAHRLALQRRSQPPAPLTADRKRSAPPHALLRPVLACLYHITALQNLRWHNIQNLLVAPLLAAGLDGIDVDVDAFTNTKQSPTATSHAAATTTTAKAAGSAETGIEALLTPPTSKLILNLTTQQTQEVTRSRSDDNNNNHSHIDRLEITLRTTLPLTTEYRLSGDNTSSTRGSA
ncbi:MAG: hypothetical protein M1825_001069, partial [Sarcosagium campestre]